MQDKSLQKLLIITLIVKISIIFLIIASFYLFPFCAICRESNFIWPSQEKINLTSSFKTWDSQHFLYLTDYWYSANNTNNAFYPLFPLLIRIFTPLFFQNDLITALFLTNLFSFIAIIFSFKLFKKIWGARVSFYACLFLLAFPTAFYLSLPYAESLFLMLVMIFFYSLYHQKFLPAFLAAFLLPLSRAPGILLIVPLIVFLWGTKRKKDFFLLPAFGLGFGTYLLMMFAATHSFWEGFKTYNNFVGHYSILKIFDLPNWFLRNFIFTRLEIHGLKTSMIDRGFFVFFLIIFFRGFKLLDKTLLSYALVLGLIPALADNFMSYTRYLLVIFPAFVILSLFLKKPAWFLTTMFLCQAIFLVRHSLNYWIA